MTASLAIMIAGVLGSGGLGVSVTPQGAPQISGPAALTAEQVAKVEAAHQAELRYCFMRDALRGIDVRGRLALTWVVSADGSVRSPRVDAGRNSIPAFAAVSCIIGRIARWRFPVPVGGEAVVRHSWIVQLVDRPERHGYSDPIRTTYSDPMLTHEDLALRKPPEWCWVKEGPLDRAALNALVRKHWAPLGRCLQKATKPKQDDLPDAGRFAGLNKFIGLRPSSALRTVEWTLGADGTPGAVRVVNHSERSSPAEQCVAELLATWSFPEAGRGSSVSCTILGPP